MRRVKLQVALDFVDLSRALEVAEGAVSAGADLLEAGTPLIKTQGLESVRRLRERFPRIPIVADMKTMDGGRIEAKAAAEAGASILVVSGAASSSTIRNCVEVAKEHGMEVSLDLLGAHDPIKRLSEIEILGVDRLEVHVGVDEQVEGRTPFGFLRKVRRLTSLPLAVAGGLDCKTVAEAISAGADVLVVGGAIVKAEDPKLASANIREAVDLAEARLAETKFGEGREENAPKAEYEENLRSASQHLLSRIRDTLEGMDWSGLLELANLLREAPRIYVTGAGRTGLVARSFGMRLMQLGLQAYIPGETVTPGAHEEDLVLAISYTGRTGGTAYLVQRALEVGARVVLITGEPESPMAERADRVLLVRSVGETVFERAVAFEHAVKIALDALFDVLSREDELDPETFRERHANLE